MADEMFSASRAFKQPHLVTGRADVEFLSRLIYIECDQIFAAFKK